MGVELDLSEGSQLRAQVEAMAEAAGRNARAEVAARLRAGEALSLERELRRAAEAASAGITAQLGAELDAGATLELHREVARAAAAAAVGNQVTVPVEVDQASTQRLSGGISNLIGGLIGLEFARSLVKWPIYTEGATAAAGITSSLAAGVVALVGSLGPLAGLLPADAAGLAAFGQAGGVALLATSGLDQAFKDMAKGEEAVKDAQQKLNDEVAQHGKGSAEAKRATEALTAAQRDQSRVLDDLEPNARRFVQTVWSMRPAFDALRDTAQRELFPGVIDALNILRPLFAQITPVVADTARMLGALTREAALMVTGLTPLIVSIGQGGIPIIERFGQAFLQLLPGLTLLTAAAQPLALWIAQLANQAAVFVSRSIQAADLSGRLTAFFARTREVASQLAGILANVAVGLYNVFRGGGSDLGRNMLASLERLTGRFRDWTESLEGRNALKDWFEDARPVLEAAGRLIDRVKDAFIGVDKAAKGDSLARLIDLITVKLVPALEQLLAGIDEEFLASLIDLTAEFTRFFAVFGTSTPLLTGAVDLLTALLKAVNFLVEKVPGFSGFVAVLGTLSPIIGGIKLAAFVRALGQGAGFWQAWARHLVPGGGLLTGAGTLRDRLTGIADKVKDLAGKTFGFKVAGEVTEDVGAEAAGAAAGGRFATGFKGALRTALAGALIIGATLIAGELTRSLDEAIRGSSWWKRWEEDFDRESPKLKARFESVSEDVSKIPIIGRWLGPQIETVGPLIHKIVEVLGDAGGAVNRFVLDIGEKLSPANLLGSIGDLAGSLLGFFGQVFSTVNGFIGPQIGNIVSFFVGLPGRIVGAMGDLAGTLLGFFGGAFASLGGWLAGALAGVVSFFIGLPGRIVGAIGDLAGTLIGYFAGALSSTAGAAASGIAGVVGQFLGLPGRALGAIGDLAGTLAGAASRALGSMAGAAAGGIGGVLGTIGGIGGRVKSAVADAGGWLIGAGRAIIEGLLSGIRSMAGAAADAAVSVVRGAVNAAKRFLGIGSPSKVFAAIGRDTMLGFERGVVTQLASVVATMSDFAAAAAAAATPGPTTFAATATGTTAATAAAAAAAFTPQPTPGATATVTVALRIDNVSIGGGADLGADWQRAMKTVAEDVLGDTIGQAVTKALSGVGTR